MDKRSLADEVLFLLFRAGDHEAFDILYERYYERLAAFVGGKVRNRTDVEDLTQDTFIQLIRRADLFDERRGTFKTFLFSIAHNRHIDGLRWLKRQADGLRAIVALGPKSLIYLVTSSVDDMLDMLENDTDRDIAVLRLEGLSVAEVSQALELSQSTVNRRLKAIRARLAADHIPPGSAPQH